jgi:glyoxylate/hydroxypyruvate reductase A
MIKALFAARPNRWHEYKGPLNAAFKDAGLSVDLALDHAPETVDYIVYAPNGPLIDFSKFTKTRAVLNLWAGVEDVVGNTTLTQPLTRMVDTGLTQGMIEWVTGHVLRHHLGIDLHITDQSGAWHSHVPPLAKDRPVTILGLGELGAACGQALAALGFPVTGWSRSPKNIHGIRCLHGDTGFAAAMTAAQIVVLLLPDTPATTNIIDARSLALMAHGCFLINPGRGPLIDDDALLAALNSGQIAHATLDVFRAEPLASDHPYWAHPNVTVTPHIASETRKETASLQIAENIRRCEAGEPLLYLVDRKVGY